MIEVEGLPSTDPGSAEPAVRGMAFTVGRGEVFGFLGSSGAGKSTTQKILIGLLTGHGGRAAVWGREPAGWGAEYYQRIGVSFELPNHYQKLTALENLRFFTSLYNRPTLDPLALLDMVGLAEHANTRAGKPSKGMQTRLVFVRALLHDPDPVFLAGPGVPGRAHLRARPGQRQAGRGHRGGPAGTRQDRLPDHARHGHRRRAVRPGGVRGGRPDRDAGLAAGTADRAEPTAGQGGLPDRHRCAGGPGLPLDGLADDADFRRVSRTRRVEALHSQEATLADVFVRTTGPVLR